MIWARESASERASERISEQNWMKALDFDVIRPFFLLFLVCLILNPLYPCCTTVSTLCYAISMYCRCYSLLCSFHSLLLAIQVWCECGSCVLLDWIRCVYLRSSSYQCWMIRIHIRFHNMLNPNMMSCWPDKYN